MRDIDSLAEWVADQLAAGADRSGESVLSLGAQPAPLAMDSGEPDTRADGQDPKRPNVVSGSSQREVPQCTLIAGDASPRKYYRVSLPAAGAKVAQHLIAVDSPASEKNPEFLHIRALLDTAGVRVPALIAADVDAGLLLLEDLGDDVLLPVLSEHSAGAWYAMALNTLGRLVSIDTATAGLEQYSAAKLTTELNLFRDWFVPRLLGLEWDDGWDHVFEELSAALVANALKQPQVVVHRDFHSRNLMVVHNGELAVIDFQDAVVGPVTYDPVSLLKDCYIRWPRQRQLAWLLDYRRLLAEQGALCDVTEATFIRWFDLMGLQRHIKVLGIFARLSLRDGKSAYLNDLPRVIAYVQEALALYAADIPAVEAFAHYFNGIAMPACREQSWLQEEPAP